MQLEHIILYLASIGSFVTLLTIIDTWAETRHHRRVIKLLRQP